VAIADRVGRAPATVHQILRSCRLNRLWHVDRATGEPVRRYKADRPGELVHVDVKKLGNIPDGGGWRVHGRAAGRRHSQAHRDRPRTVHGRPNLGYCYVHSAVDSRSRLAYSEALYDETAATEIGFLDRARAFFAGHGIGQIERLLTDNGSAYVSHAWRHHLAAAGVRHTRTRPRRPQTNGKVERFNRTLLEEWAYKRPYTSEKARRAAEPAPVLRTHRVGRSCRGSGGGVKRFEFDGGEVSDTGVAAPGVVPGLDPLEDRGTELVSAGPGLPVE
jgi:transposase InsO family protein